jgi:hypothetical protein
VQNTGHSPTGLKTGLIDLFSRFWQGKNAHKADIPRRMATYQIDL